MEKYVPSEHQLNDIEKNRDQYIGGSDLPNILRLKNYGTSTIDFAKKKLKLIPNDFNGNEYTFYGHLIEPFVRNYINSMYGYNFVEDSIVDEKRMYRGNCDGIDKNQKILLEVKTFGGKLDVDFYTPQCQFYMELFDIEECLLVGYKRPNDFYTGIIFDIDNDPSFFNLDFKEENVVVYKIHRDREVFEKIEIEICKFKYLLECLKEDAILQAQLKKPITTNII